MKDFIYIYEGWSWQMYYILILLVVHKGLKSTKVGRMQIEKKNFAEFEPRPSSHLGEKKTMLVPPATNRKTLEISIRRPSGR